MPNRNLLVVSPHPDDAELGCGGMIFQRLKAGDAVTVAVCTGEGDLRMVHSGALVPFEQRKKEQERAAHALGGVSLVWLGLAVASKFDQVPKANFVSAFDGLFNNFDEVFVPLPSYNVDHRIVWDSGLAAFRPGKLDRVALYAYEQPNQAHGEQLWGALAGKRYYALSEEAVTAKMEALLHHDSQMRGREQSLYGPAGAKALAKLRGLEVGEKFAEMVYPIREVVWS